MTPFKITANDVSSLIPPISADTGKAMAVVAPCGNIDAMISFENWKALAMK